MAKGGERKVDYDGLTTDFQRRKPKEKRWIFCRHTNVITHAHCLHANSMADIDVRHMLAKHLTYSRLVFAYGFTL